jgi:hypothetical protein
VTAPSPTPRADGSSRPGDPAAANSTGPSAVATVAPTVAPATSLDKTAAGAMQVALAGEDAAVWAYSLVAAFDPDNADTATEMREAHMVRRDDASERLTIAKVKPNPAAPAYKLPKPVTDAKSARALAMTIESDSTAAWLGVVGSTDDSGLRSYALAGLTDAAVRLTTWKKIAKATPLTVPFPGRQSSD